MTVSVDSSSTTQPGQADDKKRGAPASALLAARLGGAIALAAAASLSFDALSDLAHHAGLHRLAPLLPIAVDAFAASALFVSYRLPAGHTAHRAASRTARLALVLTVACNGLDHLLDLAGYLITEHVRELLLVAVASLPPLIVERLLHLQTALLGDGHSPVTDSVTGQRRPIILGWRFDMGRSTLAAEAAPSEEDSHRGGAVDLAHPKDCLALATDQPAVQEPGEAVQTGHDPRDEGRQPHRADEDRWLSVAVPVYRELAARTGRRPTESAFHAALTEVLTGDSDSGFPEQNGSVFAGPMSLSTAKRIRALVEARSYGTSA